MIKEPVDIGPEPFDEATFKASQEWAIGLLHQLPANDRKATEAYITNALILLWGALWGTFGTEYATAFITAQLEGMKYPPTEVFVKPKPH